MRKFEYLVSRVKVGSLIDCELFSNLGSQGWQLAAIRPGFGEFPPADTLKNPGIQASASTMTGVFGTSEVYLDQFIFMREIPPEQFPS